MTQPARVAPGAQGLLCAAVGGGGQAQEETICIWNLRTKLCLDWPVGSSNATLPAPGQGLLFTRPVGSWRPASLACWPPGHLIAVAESFPRHIPSKPPRVALERRLSVPGAGPRNEHGGIWLSPKQCRCFVCALSFYISGLTRVRGLNEMSSLRSQGESSLYN